MNRMEKFVFVSVAFGPQYVEQQERLKKSILDIYPQANLLFWTDELPDESKPFLDSLYGFKVHAVKEAMDRGYEKILWLDPAMIVMREIDILFEHPMVAIRDENKLSTYISDKYIEYSGFDRDQLKWLEVHLVGGSLYYFDMTDKATRSLFNGWYQDEKQGWFGSQQQEASEQLQGHRADESCMAMTMEQNEIYPLRPYQVGYCVADNPVFTKKHFK